jgi:hypothetical protein
MKIIRYSALFAFVLSCVSPTTRTAGTISETDTGCLIEGLVQYSSKAPVANAIVTLHDQHILKIITLAKQKVLIRSGNTKTNINGFFQIDSVDTGKYLVEINDHDTLGALVPAQVRLKDTLVTINAILGRFGTIVGKIDTGAIHAIKNPVIYLPEINQRVTIYASGYFVINNLPAYVYHIRFASGDSAITFPSDSVQIPVLPGDTTFIQSLGAKTGSIIINGQIIETPTAD